MFSRSNQLGRPLARGRPHRRGSHRVNVSPSPARNLSPCRMYIYFGDNVTGTSVMLSTGSLLSSAALRTAASLGPS
jgi:hypothetical protein